MKSITRTVIILLFAVFISAELSGQLGPSIYPLHQPWNFGKVKKGRTKNKVFFIRNIVRRKFTYKKSLQLLWVQYC